MIVPAQIEQHEARKARQARFIAPSVRMAQRIREAAEREAARRAEEAERLAHLISQYRAVPPCVPQSKRTVREIQKTVGRATGFTVEELCGPRRTASLSLARQFAIWWSRQETSLSLPSIGRMFDKDHTSVLHACRKIDAMIEAGTLIPELVALLPPEGERP